MKKITELRKLHKEDLILLIKEYQADIVQCKNKIIKMEFANSLLRDKNEIFHKNMKDYERELLLMEKTNTELRILNERYRLHIETINEEKIKLSDGVEGKGMSSFGCTKENNNLVLSVGILRESKLPFSEISKQLKVPIEECKILNQVYLREKNNE